MTKRTILDDWHEGTPEQRERIERIFQGVYDMGWRAGREAKLLEMLCLIVWWNMLMDRLYCDRG